VYVYVHVYVHVYGRIHVYLATVPSIPAVPDIPGRSRLPVCPAARQFPDCPIARPSRIGIRGHNHAGRVRERQIPAAGNDVAGGLFLEERLEEPEHVFWA
jgi:hypothetical protein